jgi:[protein-PII] uridylyltransferase
VLIGTLLHDLGKGYPGDHTEAGVELAQRIAPRMGLASHDVDVVVAMVRHHLLLPDMATRRDVEDPDTAAAVAAAVGDRDTLELLAALTEADSLATGPSAWSEWKARLVSRLVERTAAVLAGDRLPEPDVAALLPPFLEDGLHATTERCVVVAADRPGLFSVVAGVLALNGVDVHGATVGMSPRGRAVEVFDVAPAFGDVPDWDKVRTDLDDALTGRLALALRLAERSQSYQRRDTSLAPPPRVIIDNEASSRATVVEVRAPDSIGVLHHITAALADAELDICSARVSTLGHEVVDAFYVVDHAGRKITDKHALAVIEQLVLDALAGDQDRDGDGSLRST